MINNKSRFKNGSYILLFCLIFTSYRLNAKHEVYHMAHPQGSNDDARYPYSFSCHHEETEAHEERHSGDDADLCFHQHSLLLHKWLQVFFVKLCPDEPVVNCCWGKRYYFLAIHSIKPPLGFLVSHYGAFPQWHTVHFFIELLYDNSYDNEKSYENYYICFFNTDDFSTFISSKLKLNKVVFIALYIFLISGKRNLQCHITVIGLKNFFTYDLTDSLHYADKNAPVCIANNPFCSLQQKQASVWSFYWSAH